MKPRMKLEREPETAFASFLKKEYAEYTIPSFLFPVMSSW